MKLHVKCIGESDSREGLRLPEVRHTSPKQAPEEATQRRIVCKNSHVQCRRQQTAGKQLWMVREEGRGFAGSFQEGVQLRCGDSWLAQGRPMAHFCEASK